MSSSSRCVRSSSCILEPLKILFSTIFLIFIIVPALLVIFGLNEIFRIIVKVILKVKFGKQVQLIEDGKDGINCHLKNAYFRILLEFNLPFDSKQFEKLIYERIFSDLSSSNKYQWKLRQIIIQQCGYFCWKEDICFNLSNHIRCISSQEKVMTEKSLLTSIESLSDNLGEIQPQWEIVFFPNVENQRFGVVFNFHQGYSDCVAFTTMLAERLSSVKPFPYIMNPLKFKVPLSTRLAFYVKSYLYLSWNLMRGLYGNENTNNIRVATDDTDIGIPEHCHLARINLSFTALKSIRRIAKVPTSAILIYVYAQSLQIILRRKSQHIPKDIFCGYTVAKLPYSESLLNRIITIESKISLQSQKTNRDDLVKYLKEISRELSTSFDDCFVSSDFSLPGKLPSWLIHLPNAQWNNATRWFLNSNIPFSKDRVEIGDATPVTISLWPTLFRSYPYHLLGSNITFGDTICACLIAKASKLSLEEMKSLLKEIPNQLDILQQLMDQLPSDEMDSYGNV